MTRKKASEDTGSKSKKAKKTAKKPKSKKDGDASVKPVSMVRLTYTGRTAEEGNVVDTNIEKIARKHRIFRKGRHYGPSLVVVGEKWVIPGLEEGIIGMARGETRTLKIPIDEAYGPRDTALVRLVHRKEFQRLEVKPKPGMRIVIQGKEGTVTSVAQNRIRMDFNHELAGFDLEYEVTVEEIIEKQKDKVMALLQDKLPATNLKETRLSISKNNEIDIVLPNAVKYFEHIQFVKAEVSCDVYKYLPDTKLIRYIEEFESVILGTAPDIPRKTPDGVVEFGEKAAKKKAEADPDYQFE